MTGKTKSPRKKGDLLSASEQSGKEYLSLKEVAALSGVRYGAVKRDIDHGVLAAYHIGRKYFVETAAAEVYSQSHQGESKAEGYTIRQIMEKLPLSYAFLVEQIKTKRLPAVKVGRQYIIPYEAFEAFMQENKTNQ